MSRLPLIDLINLLLVPIFDMIDHKAFTDETFFAELACVFLAFLLYVDVRATELLQILVYKLLLRVQILPRPCLYPLYGEIDIVLKVVDGAPDL